MPGCPFCDPGIVASEFAGTDGVAALYNIAPFLEGHSLVVPRSHAVSLLDLDPDVAAELFAFATTVTRLLVAEFGGEGFDWSLQDGAVAGQTVPHVHLHVLVRKTGDLDRPGEWHDALDRHQRAAGTDDLDLPRRRLDPERFAADVDRLRTAAAKAGLVVPTPESPG